MPSIVEDDTIEKFREYAKSTARELDHFSHDDMEIFFNNDAYLNGILYHGKFDFKKSCDILIRSLKWRSQFNPQHTIFTAKETGLVEKGVFYLHGISKRNNRIFRFDVSKFDKRTHKRESYQRLVTYILEKHLNDVNAPLLVLFDLTGCGLNQVDFDLVRFLKSCFEDYYPHLLELIVAFNMPWIMNAAWRIIREWLEPEAVAKIKFVTSEELKDYIDIDSIPKHMGGRDTFLYSGDPYNQTELDFYNLRISDYCCRTTQFDNHLQPQHQEKLEECHSLSPKMPKSIMHRHRRVLINSRDCEDNPIVIEKSIVDEDSANPTPPTTNTRMADTFHEPEQKSFELWQHSCPIDRSETSYFPDSKALCGSAMSPLAGRRGTSKAKRQQSTKQHVNTSVLKENLVIRPADKIIIYADERATHHAQQTISLTNTSTSAIVFKIKTTSPSRFRFSQGTGILSPYGSIDIKLFLAKDFQKDDSGTIKESVDRIQILYKQFDDHCFNSDDFWRTIDLQDVHEHRIYCHIIQPSIIPEPKFRDACVGTNELQSTQNQLISSSVIWWILIALSVVNLLCVVILIVWPR